MAYLNLSPSLHLALPLSLPTVSYFPSLSSSPSPPSLTFLPLSLPSLSHFSPLSLSVPSLHLNSKKRDKYFEIDPAAGLLKLPSVQVQIIIFNRCIFSQDGTEWKAVTAVTAVTLDQVEWLPLRQSSVPGNFFLMLRL